MLVCKGRNNISNIKNNSCPQDLRVPEHFWHLQCGSSASVHPRYQVSRQVGTSGRPEPFNVGGSLWMDGFHHFTSSVTVTTDSLHPFFFLEFGWFRLVGFFLCALG